MGDRSLVLYSRLAYAEHALPFAVGLMASFFGFVIVVPLVLCFYPLWSIGDSFTWRRVYGQMDRGLGYKASFLVNLDMLYWFAIGWLIGWNFVLPRTQIPRPPRPAFRGRGAEAGDTGEPVKVRKR